MGYVQECVFHGEQTKHPIVFHEDDNGVHVSMCEECAAALVLEMLIIQIIYNKYIDIGK